MGKKKTWGIILIIAAIAIFLFASYIQIQVEDGKVKIAKAEKAVESGKKLFSLNPITEEVGKGLTGSAERKISEGREDVRMYSNISYLLKLLSIILVVVGVIFLLFGKGGKKA